jgi:ATP-dependent exoDNAse (exonuclease V) beta subunit
MSPTAGFTAEQLDAIAIRSGPLALSANAGSGKTSVLVERYVRAVTEDGIAPPRILAITFTDRAAGELRERVRVALAGAGEREAARESAGAFISTFHGFCSRLLRTHSVLAGLTPGFSVLSESQARELSDAAFDRAVHRWLDDPGALELASLFAIPGLRAAITSIYDELRSRGERRPALPVALARHDLLAAGETLARSVQAARLELAAAPPSRAVERALARLDRCGELIGAQGAPSPLALEEMGLGNRSRAVAGPACAGYEEARSAFEQACADERGVPAAALLGELLTSFGRHYETLKGARGAVDFDDLELEAGRLLAGHPELAAAWSGRFELLMVDELQDTNPRQMALLRALERENLFTVGDEFQSIYGFRHAEVGLFRERRSALAATGRGRVLSVNFRSRQPILEAVNGVFAPRFGESFVPLVAGRGGEEVGLAASESGVELLVVDTEGWEAHEERLGVELAPAPLWRRAEARLLAARLEALIAAGEARPEEIVMLFRAGTAIGTYEAALADLGLATLATAGGGFFARPEVVDLVAYLRALANPHDEIALYGVLASPLCGLSSDELAGLALRARELGVAVWDVLASEPPGPHAAAFAERFAAVRQAAGDQGLADTVAAAVREHGYDLELAALHSPERRIANVRKLERLARDFEAREGRDLRRFASALARGRAGSLRETEAPPSADGTGAITLMTIHGAKGLEFPVVCLADLGHRPGDFQPPALLVDGDRVGLRLPTLERRSIDTLAYADLHAQRNVAARAEEERLIYVAMTRARDRLILSGASRLQPWPDEGRTAISWLAPALVPGIVAFAERVAAGEPGTALVEGAGAVTVTLTLCPPELADELLGPALGRGLTPADQLPASAQRPREGAEELDVAAGGTPPALRVGARAAGTLSYTAIAEYERCPYRYHLQRIIGLPDVDVPGGGGEGAAARGVVAHALLQGMDFAAPVTPSEREVADAAALAGVNLAAGEDRRALAELVAGFGASPLCRRLAAAGEARREEPFAFELPGTDLIRGFLDVVAVEADGGLLIVDYKTDRVDDASDLAARVQAAYGLQRLVYALAGLATGAPAVEVAHSFLRLPERVFSARFAAGERERLEGALRQRLAPLRAGRFEVSADPDRERCGSCPGRARLCSHDEAMTAREPLVAGLYGPPPPLDRAPFDW